MRMEDLGSQIPAQKTPGRAVAGGIDVVLVAGENLAGSEGFGSV